MAKILDQINDQMNFELASGYIYLSMAAYLRDRGYDGMAHFMHEQAHEEYEHAMKMYDFLGDVEYLPVFQELPKPDANYVDELDVFKKALAHEKVVTGRIVDLVDLAREEKDKRAESMLQWFIDEQVEEEITFSGLVEAFERADGDFRMLYLLDKELGKREEE